MDISKATSVISEDVIDTMARLGMLKYVDGDHQIVATPVGFVGWVGLRCFALWLDTKHYGGAALKYEALCYATSELGTCTCT